MTILDLRRTLQTRFDFEWSLPPKLPLGILTTNEAFKRAKAEKKNPQEIATALGGEIQEFLATEDLPFKVTTVGPYVNLLPTSTYLNSLLKNGLDYALPTREERIFLDFFSPNVGKEMHIGHMRSGNIGESLRRLLALSHAEIITDNHIADCGIQFAILIWGVEHVTRLKLPFSKVDFETDPEDVIEQLNRVYVATNALLETNPEIREEAQALASTLETAIRTEQTAQYARKFEIIEQIVEANNHAFSAGESYLSLNEHRTEESPITPELVVRLQTQPGVWHASGQHRSGEFDVILGESYYQQFLGEFDFWYAQGLVEKEGEGYYVDLEEEGLGRAYLISSAGYSIYTGRDVLARFVWAGLFGADTLISVADNRQSHSFKQVFAVIRRVVQAGVYAERAFAGLSQEQTTRAVETLKKATSLHHIGFGFISLASGVMSARRGTVVKFHDFARELEAQVDSVLTEKNAKLRKRIPYYQKVQQLSAATIKWFDLSRDKDQDIVFDAGQMLAFEGNTGIYQLYTYARVCNILAKVETSAQLTSESITLLNETEQELLLEAYTLPYTLEQATERLTPHLVATHLYSLNTKINSWYAAHSVAQEPDPARRDALLALLRLLKTHLAFCLDLLAIEPLEQI